MQNNNAIIKQNIVLNAIGMTTRSRLSKLPFGTAQCDQLPPMAVLRLDAQIRPAIEKVVTWCDVSNEETQVEKKR